MHKDENHNKTKRYLYGGGLLWDSALLIAPKLLERTMRPQLYPGYLIFLKRPNRRNLSQFVDNVEETGKMQVSKVRKKERKKEKNH